jgi:hypothetical protein
MLTHVRLSRGDGIFTAEGGLAMAGDDNGGDVAFLSKGRRHGG